MTRENWEAVLADHGGPDHWFDRLAYADWLEEQGEIQEAEAWRWVVTKEIPLSTADLPESEEPTNKFNPCLRTIVSSLYP
jgi:uncharacterized protein (TIGR02996 family)